MVNITFNDIRGYVYKKMNDEQYYIKRGVRKITNIYRGKHCCERCGVRHSKCSPLTFHHVYSKLYSISDIAYHKIEVPVSLFLDDINSCELLCRKCHDQEDNMPHQSIGRT